MDKKAMYHLTYGLFVLTARDEKDNGCIINTAMQVTTTPNRISITVSKQNFTHDMIAATGEFNVSILDQSTPFEVFEHFGFASGRDMDKFVGNELPRTANGILYLTEYASAVISGKVFAQIDLGTHTMFLADVTDAMVLSSSPPVTYAYYQSSIKPKPQSKKSGWVCKVCGYTYEDDLLPEDFVCPLCKHGAIDFERIGG